MKQAFIVDAIRTPFGRYGGALSSVRTDDLGAIPLKALMARNPGVDWSAVDDVLYGCANQAGEDNRNVAHMCSLLAGVPPRVMGIGPAPATEKVLQRTGLRLDQMDVIELNEAFAAQGLAVLRMLGLKDDDERVNAWGGAIALGHPLGASGARLATTAVNRLHATGGKYALCTMCIGVGQGIALILERV